MISPIDRLLDQIDWRCTHCGARKKDGCDCFITLHCPDCGRTKWVAREAADPPGPTLELRCEKCWD